MDLRGTAVWGAFLLGGLTIFGAVGHWIGVTVKAIEEGRGYDVRLADMLAIGLMVFLLGAGMVAGAWQTTKEGGNGLALAGTAAALVAVLLVVLWPIVFTGPEGNVPGAIVTVAVFGAEAAIAFMAS